MISQGKFYTLDLELRWFPTDALLHAQVIIPLGLLLHVCPDCGQVGAAALGVGGQQPQDFGQLLRRQRGEHGAGDAGGDVVLVPLQGSG